MTKSEALEKTIELWEEIKEKKIENKRAYTRDLDVPFGCYLCAYSIEMSKGFNQFYKAEELGNIISKCTFCPITNWHKDKEQGKSTRRCTNVDSVYMQKYKAYELADDIIKLCKEELNKNYII